MKKRLLSLLMALVMVLGMLPTSILTTEANSGLGQVRVIVENTTYSVEDGAPWEGTLLDTAVDLTAEMTMMSAIYTALNAADIESEGADGTYISGINGLYEFDGGSESGWMGTLNDWFTNMGFASYSVASGDLMAGDVIRVMYTCTGLGADIGGGRNDISDTSLTALSVSGCEMEPVFSSDMLAYTVALPENVNSVTVSATASNKQNQVYLLVGETEYRRTASVPVTDGTVITVRCGEATGGTSYTLTFEQGSTVPEVVTADVIIRSQLAGAYLHGFDSAVAVASNLAESYGYEDAVEGVSALDVLVKSHELAFGEDFTPETADDYLTVSGTDGNTNVTMQFGTEGLYGGFFVNQGFPNDGTQGDYGYNGTLVGTQQIVTGDVADFFFYEDPDWCDYYSWVMMPETKNQDGTVTVTVKGFMVMGASAYGTPAALVEAAEPLENAGLAWIDETTGAVTPIEDVYTDENGQATVTVAQNETRKLVAISNEAGSLYVLMNPSAVEAAEYPAETYTATFNGHTAQVNSFKVYTYTDGIKGETDLLEGITDSDSSNTQSYTTQLPAGNYWVEGYDTSGVCSGSILVTVTADGDNTFAVNRVYQLKASNSGWILGTDYTIRADVVAQDMTKRIVELGTAADYSGNQLPSVLCLYGDTVKITYTPTAVRVAENYIETFKSQTLTASSSSFGVSIPQAVAVTFQAPAGSVVSAGYRNGSSYYDYSFSSARSVVTEGETVSYTFMIPKNTTWFYRVSRPANDGVTYWNWGRWSADTTVEITASDLYIGSQEFTPDTIYRYEKNIYDRADIYLNINGQGYMDMNVNERYQLNVFRNWQVIESFTNNQIALPDVHYKVIDINGNESDLLTITPDANNSSVATMTANREGTAIVLVTYDALTHASGQGGTQFSAIWPECTGVFVVTVGQGEANIETGMLAERFDNADTALDAEHDVLFYLGNQGAEYTFTPESGTTVTVARAEVTAALLTYNGFTSTGVAVNEDGSVTVSGLTSGRHIIKVEKDGKATYQVVTARGVSYEIQDADGNALTAEQITGLSAGDTIYLQFSNLVNPAEKLSGAYNFNASILYFGEDGTSFRSIPGSAFGVYDFSGNPVRQKIEITIPKYWTGETYTMNGAIAMAGFANVAIGGHRGVTYATGINPGFNAPSVGMTLGAMPSITFPLAETAFLVGKLAFQDENGNTIDAAGLTVTLTDTAGNAQTMNADGTFMCVAEEYSYVVNGAGYMYTTGSVTVTEGGENNFVITLQTASAGAWDGITTTEPAADENGVYRISTGAELAWFAAAVNAGNGSVSGILTADIDLADYPWTPIGTSGSANRFTGTLDGDGHAITNLNVNVTTSNSGLFGYIYQGAVVKDLTVSGSVNSTNTYAAGLAGYAYGSTANPVTIENCIVDVDVTIDVSTRRNYAAGIVAYASNVNISNCANLGDVTMGGNYAAGIASYVNSCTITGCYNAGNITGAGYLGGIMGYNGTSAITMTACYNTGNVTGTSTYVGGIGAWLKGSSTVSDVYNVGTVTGGNAESLFGILQTATLTRGYSLSGTTDSYGEALASYRLKVAELDAEYFGGTCDGYPALLWQTDVQFHSSSNGTVTAPTCTEDGYTSYICTECSVSYRSDYVDALDHDWCDDEVGCDDCVYTAPACTVEGSIVRTCRREGCDETHTDVIPATGHTEDESETVDRGYYADCVCAVCGESYVIWDDWRLNYMDLPSVGLSAISMADNTYPWIWNAETERFESSNKGINSSTSQSSLEVALTEPATISFHYGVSSENRYDKLTITALIGDQTVTIADAISGTSESTFTYDLPAGTYTLTFTYAKDSSSASGGDIGWFSEMVIDVDEGPILAQAVMNLIDAIGEVTLEDAAAIMEARTAYDALDEIPKAAVVNYSVLQAAEEELARLQASDADKRAAAAVDELIADIGEVTLEDENAITAARDAYNNALTDEQKLLVENLAILEAAEAKLAELKTPAPENLDLDKVYAETGDYLTNAAKQYGLTVNSIGGEWIVIGLERAGRDTPNAEAYYAEVLKFVQENINDKEQLHRAKSTENARVILALTALGYDVTDVGGHNLLAGLTDMNYVRKQGINGPIWTLIAFDSRNYVIPAGGDVTREKLTEAILAAQLADGGWALSGVNADTDMTGMALTALAPYYDTDPAVKAAVDKALTCLSQTQHDDGGFGSVDGACAESAAQVIVALTALGIDPQTDTQFVKNGRSVLDALCDYYVEGGGFKHIAILERDGMATEQGYYALAAYYRFKAGKTSLYDLSDVTIAKNKVQTKLEITAGGIAVVPESLKAAGLATPDAVKQAIVKAMISENKNIAQDNVAHYEVTLMYSEDGGKTWIKADDTHFPANGKLTITLPYPEGTDSSYSFTVVHMFTSTAFGKTPGDVEMPKVTNTKDGIQFEVTGLSPITVGWTAPKTSESPETGDGSHIALYSGLLLVSVTCMAALMLSAQKKKGKYSK